MYQRYHPYQIANYHSSYASKCNDDVDARFKVEYDDIIIALRLNDVDIVRIAVCQLECYPSSWSNSAISLFAAIIITQAFVKLSVIIDIVIVIITVMVIVIISVIAIFIFTVVP